MRIGHEWIGCSSVQTGVLKRSQKWLTYWDRINNLIFGKFFGKDKIHNQVGVSGVFMFLDQLGFVYPTFLK